MELLRFVVLQSLRWIPCVCCMICGLKDEGLQKQKHKQKQNTKKPQKKQKEKKNITKKPPKQSRC